MSRRVFVLAVAAQLFAGCSTATDSSVERRSGEGPDGIESTSPRGERAALTGTVTDVWRTETTTEGRLRRHEWITVEEDSDAKGCQKNPLSDGCEKIHFELDDARVFLEGRDKLEPESLGALERGQEVRADYTGQDVATSYPALTSANTVVILKPR